MVKCSREEIKMKEAVKLVPVVVLLTASASLLAQELTGGTEAKSSSQKMMVIDPKVRDDMMSTTQEMDRQVQELKTCVARERAAAASSGRPISPAEGAALDAQIQALQKSIQQLRQQTDNGPHYLDQKNSLRP
jgi:LDH2 family malate/lactate/ureidoglycolate dehydrogenase